LLSKIIIKVLEGSFESNILDGKAESAGVATLRLGRCVLPQSVLVHTLRE